MDSGEQSGNNRQMGALDYNTPMMMMMVMMMLVMMTLFMMTMKILVMMAITVLMGLIFSPNTNSYQVSTTKFIQKYFFRAGTGVRMIIDYFSSH